MKNHYIKSILILLVGVFLYATDRDICEISIDNQEGWNLVGLPVYASDNTYLTLFPGSVGETLYSYNDGYSLDSSLVQGEGYWLRFSEDLSNTITGECMDDFTISLMEGWNLISVGSYLVNSYDIIDPAGIIVDGTIYGFSGGYYEPSVLEPGKGYWVRCFNDGEIIIPEIEETTVTDIDGNVYQIVQIGDQVWMAENLKVTHYNDGSEIPTGYSSSEWGNLSTGAYAVYGDNESNAEIYGNLYNWYAVDDSRNIAPEGWHVPTDDEIKELEMYLGMSQEEADDTGWRGTNEGSKLAGRADLWTDGNLENNPEFGTSGFNLLPGGYRYVGGSYGGMGLLGCFWSSTEGGSGNAWNRALHCSYSGIARSNYYKEGGFSVRCVRD